MQIYIDNRDAGGNIKFWRDHRPGGKWRWILFDTDFGFAHYEKQSYRFNSLAFHTASNGPNWPNPPWSTFNLRMLLKNKGFRDRFILRFADRINTLFDTAYLFPRIDSFAQNIRAELPRHWARWELEESRWHFEINAMKQFARQRPDYMRRFLQEAYPFIGPQVQLSIEVEGGGEVVLNELISIREAFSGIYFKNLGGGVRAKPGFGTLFSHWELNGQRMESPELKLKFEDKTLVVKAVFVKGQHPLSKQMVINEISHRDTTAGDWVEFYNASEEDLDLQGWQMRDRQGHEFIFPPIQLRAGSYLVVCQDLGRFRLRFPNDSIQAIGDFNFGLGKRRDKIEIYDREGQPVDSIGYDLPKASAQGIFYLALRDVDADNGQFENWKIEEGEPSPGRINVQFVEHRHFQKKNDILQYVKYGALSAGIMALGMMAYLRLRKSKN